MLDSVLFSFLESIKSERTKAKLQCYVFLCIFRILFCNVKCIKDSSRVILSITLKLYSSPDLSKTVSCNTCIGSEVLGLDILYGKDHALGVTVLINVHQSYSATWIYGHVLCPRALAKLDPVVD